MELSALRRVCEIKKSAICMQYGISHAFLAYFIPKRLPFRPRQKSKGSDEDWFIAQTAIAPLDAIRPRYASTGRRANIPARAIPVTAPYMAPNTAQPATPSVTPAVRPPKIHPAALASTHQYERGIRR